jgi:spermidine synthase
VRPGSSDLVVEIDEGLVDVARDHLGLVTGRGIEVRVGDARLALAGSDALPSDGFDLVIGDAFSGTVVPWHLTTREVVEQVRRVLRPDGVYVQNVIDGGPNRFARAELATVLDVFAHVVIIVPPDGVPITRRVNQIIVASDHPLPALRIAAADGTVLDAASTRAFVDGAQPLRDDFAPVDQLLFG